MNAEPAATIAAMCVGNGWFKTDNVTREQAPGGMDMEEVVAATVLSPNCTETQMVL